MNITLNSDTIELDKPININEFLLSQGYADKMVAIAINGSFVPRSSYKEHLINENDDIEIVAPMQGG